MNIKYVRTPAQHFSTQFYLVTLSIYDSMLKVPTWTVLLISMFYGLISLLALLGNSLVIYVVITSRRMQVSHKRIKRPKGRERLSLIFWQFYSGGGGGVFVRQSFN